MPRDRDFKRLVRRRMHKTGEAYTSARAQLARGAGQPRPSPSRPGGPAMRNFDRFTGRARRALAAAHAEAGGRAVGGEHLLLGLLRVDDGMAAKALQQMGVDRAALESRLKGEAPDASSGGPLNATARRAIELAFEQAAGLGHGFVGTEHLLLGIVAEGTSAGARALGDAGVSLDRARRRIGEGHVAGPRPRESPAETWEPLAGTGLRPLLEAARAQRATGTLTVRQPDGGTATLYLLFGHLFHAVAGTAVGDEAVLAALAWTEGDHSFDRGARLPDQGSVRSSIADLVARAGT
jgi:hypothetical protein